MSQPMWTPTKGTRRGVRVVHSDRGREQLQSMEAMSTLAGGIAHAFNNMLTAIGFETELALSRLASDEPARKHLREIEKVGERGAALARQLLAFSGSQVLHPKPLQLNALVSDLMDGMRRLVGEKIEIETVLDPELDRIEADPEQIEHAVMNLISNARDAMPTGGRLTLETANADLKAADLANPLRSSPGRYVLLKVSDTGSGMREEIRRRVFEPFFTTKTAAEAAGLGLATVYGIVTQSGGQIEVESEPGKGTTFLIHLPSSVQPRRAGEPSGDEGNWQTILLVEDEDNVRRPLAEILTGNGYAVLEAGDAAEAIAVSKRHTGPIHLMVTDILMGAMSGVELAEELAFQRPEMKVLFATGYPAGLAERSSLLVEEAPLLKKPFTGRALAAKIREVLEGAD